MGTETEMGREALWFAECKRLAESKIGDLVLRDGNSAGRCGRSSGIKVSFHI